ncbi:MAG: Gfo/Idh/MocA family oxidoreductase [Verrucomicrobia bacterium]|nr:Gfo/Idh/MocA family oxidoreductase [Verrucomicrobiota bacterium]MDA1088642.1 Gfo/Idh/MocA family oxidoreductase [Verrucomicrobiota bacterium]
MSKKKRYAQVGVGGRSVMFSDAIANLYHESCVMVAFCDVNAGRLRDRIEAEPFKTQGVPGYAPEDFDRMVAETRPDIVIVTTRDSSHDLYICRAMELGCDVVTEKPMTISAEKCQRIVDTQARTGRECRVTFNYRYSPPRTQVKDLLMSGLIGEVLSVDFQWMLDTRHGADYFRRWHRRKENSGGLMVHKATHHFDLVNWWLSAVPETVFATGHRRYATPRTAERLGLTNRGERCHGCPDAKKCAYELDLSANEGLKAMYLDNEGHDGYFRDRCIFSEDMDIEDSMQAIVTYDNEVRMSYSLNAFCAWEGYTICFNGTKGRLEHKCMESAYINGDGTVQGALQSDGTTIRVYPLRDDAYLVPLWEAEGGHGGGDEPLLKDVLAAQGEDAYRRAADHRAGAYSILTGIAANQSMASGKQVRIRDLVSGLARPDYPAMPTSADPLPMPVKPKSA